MYPVEGVVRPIENLAGSLLNERWRVAGLVSKNAFQTGSCFSVGYVVEDEWHVGTKAFAKVLDFSRALQDRDTARLLHEMTDAYIFERSLLELCGQHGLTKIVRGLDYGELQRSDVPLGKLFFIIFEIAEGDVRKFISEKGDGGLAWRLSVLRDVAIGLNQLHKKSVFHQDLKPSNILVFEKGEVSKLADLGRAHCSAIRAPHDGNRRPGAFYYAPPEQIYDHQIQDLLLHRQAGELYLLGSMLDFFVTQKPTTVRLIEKLADVHRPFAFNESGWRGFFRDVLPHLQSAYGSIVEEFSSQLRQSLSFEGGDQAVEQIANELVSLYRYSTNPDPALRGHPRARRMVHGSDFDLQRFISGFEILSKKLRVRERTRNAAAP